MDNRRSPARNPRDIYSNSARSARPGYRRGADYDTDEIDIYNRVGRDVYSSSGTRARSAPRRRKKKKSGCLGKLLAMIFSLILVVALGGIAYSAVMFSRLNRSDNADSAQLAKYVQQPAAAPKWAVKSDGSVMNILLLGVDENPEDGSDGRSDSNLLLSINSKSKKMHLVSFLRDSYLEIPTVGKNKLNAAYANGGAALTLQTLENNYRVNIDKFVSVNFNNFAAVIDKMGGLDVPMSAGACEEENANIGTHFRAGLNHLNGKQSLYYARIRNAADSFGHDDYGRAGRQRQVIELMIQKMKSMNPIESSKVMYDYLPYVKTNLSDSELAYLATVGATLSSYKTESMQIPAPNTFDDKKVVKGIGDVVELDLEKNCSLLRQFLYGDAAADT